MCCKVSVILPVYNGAEYLRDCLDSLMHQTFGDFELVIIDDCSTDQTPDIIKQYSDTRIRYFKNDTNSGIVFSLNKAISLSQGEYIARMDADDICLPERLEKQVAFLDEHSDFGLISTWFEMFGAANGIVRYETDPERIKCKLLFSLQLLHPGWMLRRSLLADHALSYKEDYKYAEDWDLLVRAATVTRFSNIPQVLMRYRINPKQITHVFSEPQQKVADQVARDQLAALEISLTDEEFRLYRNSFGRREVLLTPEEMKKLICILQTLEQSNHQLQKYDPGILHTVIQEELYHLAYYNLRQGSASGLVFLHSPFYKGLQLSFTNRLKLWIRCMTIKK